MIPANASIRKGPEGKYPLHYLVWHNRHRELEKEVRAGQVRAPSGAVGTPRPGTPAGVERGCGAGCPASPARLHCFFVRSAAFVLVYGGEGDGSGPRPLLSGGDGQPTRVPYPLRLG